MSSKRAALIIANYQYQDENLRKLIAPTQDAKILAQVLEEPAIGGFEVQTLINESSYRLNEKIEDFFDDRRPDDLLLLYFSGHGLKDIRGQLYFAATNTNRKRLNSTAISAHFVNQMMSYSRSKRQVLLLDCCYSGAFVRGAKAEETLGDNVGINEQLQGRGRIVLTASSAMQYAFEGDEVKGQGIRSVFTDALVKGLQTGEADLDGDGKIDLDELYEYVFNRVTDKTPNQTPEKSIERVQGKIIIARNPNPLVTLVEQSPGSKELITGSKTRVRKKVNRENTILIVDSSVAWREVYSDFLESQKGFKVLLANNANEAIEIIKLSKVDLVISELRLNEVDSEDQSGLEVLSVAQNQRPKIPVLLISGYFNVKTARIAFEQGGTVFEKDEFSGEELIQAVHSALYDV